jgi:cold shock CspA family protein
MRYDRQGEVGSTTRRVSGFITPDSGEKDCFVHFSAIQGSGIHVTGRG